MLAFLLSYLLLYKYAALFAFAFSIAVILPLPANGILLAAGAFASFGYFDLPAAIAVATAANVAGDTLDYFIARRYGPKVFAKFRLARRYYFERVEHGFREHAGLTVFITRFVGPIDLFTTLFAGSVGLPAATFIWYDFLGNFVSNVLVILVGYAAGNYWQDFSGLVDVIGWILLVAIVLFLVLRVFIRRHRRNKEHLESGILPSI